MVLLATGLDSEDKMSQIVPSAGFTPPFDYSNFADTFDLSLLPSDLPLSPSTNFYTQSPPPPKIITSFHQSEEPLGPDFHKLLDREQSPVLPQAQQINSLFLEVPSTKNYHANSPTGALSPYSPNSSLSTCSSYYPNSPNSFYSQSPRDEFFGVQLIKQEFIKQENYSSCSSESSFQTGEDLFHLLQNNLSNSDQKAPVIKQESTVDFSTLLDCEEQNYPSTLLTFTSAEDSSVQIKTQHQDHQLLREALNDTSFQKKFNIRPIEFGFFSATKMEEDHHQGERNDKNILASCSEPLANDSIEPVLNLAIEQMKKDVDKTCSTLGISPDPCKWSKNNVISWLQWTSREFRIPEPIADQWDISGSGLLCLSEEEFIRRSSEGGAMLYAQLEIWKAAYLEDISAMQWLPETTSIVSSGDNSDDEEDDAASSQTDLTSTTDTSNSCPSNPATPKPSTPTTQAKTTSTGTTSSHIHLWQFLKELLASPHLHGSCIRWLDRSRGIFKIEDSVKVARLWGKRKNRPAMNYDKLSRSIRQYYKKGIMKKTERSQRLVYQFCHPYCL